MELDTDLTTLRVSKGGGEGGGGGGKKEVTATAKIQTRKLSPPNPAKRLNYPSTSLPARNSA